MIIRKQWAFAVGILCIVLIRFNNAVAADSVLQPQTTEAVYQLANRCYFLVNDQRFLTKQASGVYAFSSQSESAEPLYFKPTGLGRFMLFDSDAQWMAAKEGLVSLTENQLDESAEWRVTEQESQRFRIQSSQTLAWLSTSENQLMLSANENQGESFQLQAADHCALFPEATTNTEGEPAIGTWPDGSVWGMADAHNHLFGSMAFTGNVMDGDVFHPLGITKALNDCRSEHGKNGWLDITGYVSEGRGDEFQRLLELPSFYKNDIPLHDTEGYPNFPFWPNNYTTTHTVSYYKWLERSYLGGLRLLVNMAVESGPLCKLGKAALKAYGPQDDQLEYDPNASCNGSVTAMKQLQATYDLQDYIDAQSGGPGKGWFRIVQSPEEARAVIADKKMAVLMGAELPDLFGCIDGEEGGRADCTEEYIDEKLDEYRALGFQTLFPLHHYDNDFGGAHVFNGVIEVAKVVQDGRLFQYEPCDDDEDYVPLLALQIPGDYFELIPKTIRELPLFPLVPKAEEYCNKKSITSLGRHLIKAMMARGIMIETNHMSPKMKEAVLAMAEEYDYPLMDTHQRKAWLPEFQDFEKRYLSLGGVISPMSNMTVPVDSYSSVKRSCHNYTSQDISISLMAIGDVRSELGLYPGTVFSTDAQGMVGHAYPRFGPLAPCDEPQTNPVVYPFKSFDGAVTFYQQQTGHRVFDFNTDGLAHLGLFPDMVEDMRRQGMPDEKVQRLFQGAESYLRAWERAIDRSKSLQLIE